MCMSCGRNAYLHAQVMRYVCDDHAYLMQLDEFVTVLRAVV